MWCKGRVGSFVMWCMVEDLQLVGSSSLILCGLCSSVEFVIPRISSDNMNTSTDTRCRYVLRVYSGNSSYGEKVCRVCLLKVQSS